MVHLDLWALWRGALAEHMETWQARPWPRPGRKQGGTFYKARQVEAAGNYAKLMAGQSRPGMVEASVCCGSCVCARETQETSAAGRMVVPYVCTNSSSACRTKGSGDDLYR